MDVLKKIFIFLTFIAGDNSNVLVSLVKANGHSHDKISMSKNGTTFSGINHIDLKDPQTGASIFTTHKPHYTLQSGVSNLRTKSISASRITSPIDVPLSINNTRAQILFRGTEGVSLNGKELFLSADQNVSLNSQNGSVILSGHNGIFLDMKNIPIIGHHGIKIDNNRQYKICVCMPQVKLFRVPIEPSSYILKGICSHFNATNDPCI